MTKMSTKMKGKKKRWETSLKISICAAEYVFSFFNLFCWHYKNYVWLCIIIVKKSSCFNWCLYFQLLKLALVHLLVKNHIPHKTQGSLHYTFIQRYQKCRSCFSPKINNSMQMKWPSSPRFFLLRFNYAVCLSALFYQVNAWNRLCSLIKLKRIFLH